MITKGMIMLLQWHRPLESRFANWLETFNEVMTLLVLYTVMCFSDYVTDPELRNWLGFAFIAFVCFQALVHMAIMFYDVYYSLRLLAKRYHNRRCHKRNMEEKKSKTVNQPVLKPETLQNSQELVD